MNPIHPADQKLTELYKDFLPRRIFDAHMHLYLGESIPRSHKTGVFSLDKALAEDYLTDMLPLLPGVEGVRLNMLPFPDPALTDLSNGLRDKANRHIITQTALSDDWVGAAYVLPGDTEADIRTMTSFPGIRCLKPYYFGAEPCLGASASIASFLPESAWRVANEKTVPIVLHMMRSNLADPENFSYVESMTERYPQAPLVLAHCARGFAGWTAVKYIPRLADRDNIWFDLSAVCEVGPMMASILKTAGKRTVWGSDWPVCMNRGRVVSLVDDQYWHLDQGCAAIAAENLFAFYQTALLLDLDMTQIEDIFYNNAANLFR